MFARAALLLLVAAIPGSASAAVAAVGASATILEPARLPSQMFRPEDATAGHSRVLQFNEVSRTRLAQLPNDHIVRAVVIEFE